MSYVISPNVRTIGGRIECQWTDVNVDGYVILDGYRADYASVVGGEKVDIRVNSPTDPITTITLSPGDNTVNAIVNRINSFIPDLATIPALADTPAIRLRHHTYLEVVNIYSRTVDFARIGLPLATRDGRDGYSINSYKLIDGTATNLSGGGTGIDRFDDLSIPIDIDPGSNTVTMWATITNIDINCLCGIQLSAWWSNGFEGEPDASMIAVIQLPGSAVITTPPVINPFITTVGSIKQIFLLDVLQVDKVFFNPITIPVPRGATKLRVGVALGQVNNDSTFNSFIELPKVTVAMYQGAS